MSLLNIIKKWSWMFKEHLMTSLTVQCGGTMTKWGEINMDQMGAELWRFVKDICELYKEARVRDVYRGLDLCVEPVDVTAGCQRAAEPCHTATPQGSTRHHHQGGLHHDTMTDSITLGRPDGTAASSV
ncbi:dynein axonemal heavy chain 11-like [Salvelinus alpinus]|uniref:dynein axonemal heavy chain 11-like n=1 Tax=Salvelinus alpinus TaxID=8036 RepID=UPI0039FD2E1E